MDKLKPCPFCGGEARTGFAINDYNRWGVECTRCGATVEVADWCGDCDTEENAIKTWNRRASEASNEVIAKSRDKWISVEERLPECEPGAEVGNITFRLKSGTIYTGCFGRGGLQRDKYFRNWTASGEGWDAEYVTHWVRLSDPEEVENDG